MPVDRWTEVQILGQLLLMQSVLTSLPDAAILSFVAEGLTDIPGCESVRVEHGDPGQPGQPGRSGAPYRFALKSGAAQHGELVLQITDPARFAPFADHVRNFTFMLSLILEERAQRRTIARHRSELEQMVQARTRQLRDEVAAGQRMLAALRESEENLAITLQSIGDGVIATDGEGRVARMNPVAERLCGWTLAEARLRPLAEVFQVIDASTGARVIDPVRLAMERGEAVGLVNHAVLIARDGSRHQIADSAAPIRDAAGTIVGVVLVFSDVSEKYRVEDALRVSEERHRLLAENASDVIWTMNFDGRMTYISPSIEKLCGFTPAEAISNSAYQALVPESVALAANGLKQARAAVAEGKPVPTFRAELEHLRKDGSTVWAEVTASAMRNAAGDVIGLLGVTRDVSERRRVADRLRESEATFRKLFEESSDAILLIDAQGVFVECNQAALDLSKMSRDDFLQRTPAQISPELQPDGRRSSQASEEAIARARTTGLQRFDWTHVDAEGGRFVVEVSLMPISLKGQTMVHVTWRDITERLAAAEKIERLAYYDPLTDLPNRRLVLDRLQHALSTGARHHRFGVLMLLDMDDFKTLNDTLGHDVGDRLLVEVAARLRSCVRETDTVARHGGDEFVVILEDFADDDQAMVQAQRVAADILRAVSQTYQLDLTSSAAVPNSRSYHCTSSIGITTFHDHSVSVDELLKRADTAMYQAKAAGRNSARFFDPEMQAAVTARAALDNDLRVALQEGQFCLFYQPQVDDAGRVCGAEALIRWRHPRRGLVSPADFIVQAESSGLIIPIGQWVLRTACAQIKDWAARAQTAHLVLAVNVSARQFRHADFVEQVLAVVEQTGADPTRLKLELTETLLLDDVEDVIAKMSVLKARGIRFALDDFGTGYSSLSYLKRLPLDQLKIDQSFVGGVLDDPNDAAIARTIVALARSMGLDAIAEGVESEAQRAFLAANGCSAFQGYLFGRPVPIEDFTERPDLGSAT